MSIKERLEDAGFFIDSEEVEKAITIDGFDDAIIGMSEDFRIVYDYDKMVLCLMLHDDMSEEEAMDFLDYSVLRTYKLYGESHPIILYKV